MRRHVIIGNGAAGIAAAERIRKLDASGDITILSAERYAVYAKCLLADYLSGEIADQRMSIRPADFYDRKRIRLERDQRVVRIDPVQRQVITERAAFAYDKLLIATGSVPMQLPIPGVTATNCFTLGTFDAAKHLADAARTARRIAVIGAGFVGLEMAVNLYKTGKEVTIIERAPGILPGQLDARASGILQQALEEAGIRLVLGTAVARVTTPLTSRFRQFIHQGSPTQCLMLDDGRRLNADMIVMAAGSRPNLDFARETGFAINRGLLVDTYLQTSIADIYAAGDVVESIDAVTGAMSLSPIWPNAVMQGEVAGDNMAGRPREFSPLISMQNAAEFREIPLIAMGLTAPTGAGYEEYIDDRPTETIYRKVIVKDDVIVGMIFLGDLRNAGVIGALIKNHTNVQALKSNLLNPNFGYCEVAALG